MQDLLQPLTLADYTFLTGIIEGPVGFTEDMKLRHLLNAFEADENESNRQALTLHLEKEIRYLGSADLAYLLRSVTGKEPGVPFREIVQDVSKALKVSPSRQGTDQEMLVELVQLYATQQFASLSTEEQQVLLENLGVDRDRATAFLKRSAGVFALPTLIQAFGTFVVNGLIKTVIFGTIAKIIGKQLAMRLFNFLVSRFPWWVAWIGPALWTLSIGWTVIDVQGPAYRKTIPAVLYLGLVGLRQQEEVPA